MMELWCSRKAGKCRRDSGSAALHRGDVNQESRKFTNAQALLPQTACHLRLSRYLPGSPRLCCAEILINPPYSELWRFSRPCSGVATQRSPKNGSLVWEDDASPETRFRRVQQVSSPSGRALTGMPLEMPDPDDEES